MIEFEDFHPSRNNIFGGGTFYSRQDKELLKKLNDFVKKNNVDVINAETIVSTFKDHQKFSLRLWYKKRKLHNLKL